MHNIKSGMISVLLSLLLAANAQALIVNPPMAIDRVVTVQMIQTGDGTNLATMFGDAMQQAAILGFIDEIWAQAGIDVNFLGPTTYIDSFAYEGTPGMMNPRPSADLGAIQSNGISDGVSNTDSLALDMYFVNIVPFSPLLSKNSVNGLAFRPGKTSAISVGMNLLDFNGDREIVASVVAHEIGHNLGLPHLSEL